jgi:methionine synthase II (cobalamin-independent)
VPDLESEDSILRRIEEASKYVPVEQLALSPQCGFASVKEAIFYRSMISGESWNSS